MRGGAPAAVLDGLLIALLVCLPWFEGGATPFGLFLTHTLIFLLVGGALLVRAREGNVALQAGWELVAGLGLVAAFAISFLRVDYFFGPSLTLWTIFMTALFAAAMVLMGGTRWRLRAGAVVAASAAQAITVLLLPAPPNLTSPGTFANANQLAAYLVVGALVAGGLAIDFLRSGRRVAAAACLAAALLDVGIVMKVGARGALLSLILVSIFWMMGAARVLARRSRSILWGALGILALISVVSVAARFEKISDPYRFDRVRIWKAGIDAALDHPILGMGPGMFQARGYRYAFPLEREMYRYSKLAGSTHSTYLQVLAETGLVGLIGLLALVATLVPRLWRMRLGDPVTGAAGAGAALALLVCLVHGVVDTPFDVPAVTLSLVALIVPMLSSRSPSDSPLYLDVSTKPGRGRRLGWLALAAVAVPAYLGGVLLPYAADISFDMGAAASRRGAPDAAVTRAIALDPFNPAYIAGRAQIRWRRDRPLDPQTFAEVDLDLEEAHRIDPGRPEFLLLLAQLHARACFELSADPASLGRVERYYREALALGGKDPRPRLELALFLLAQGGSAGEALALISEALDLEPNYAGARFALARALADAGRRQEAASQLARLEDLRRDLASYTAKNGYEEDLMRVDGRAIEDLGARLR